MTGAISALEAAVEIEPGFMQAKAVLLEAFQAYAVNLPDNDRKALKSKISRLKYGMLGMDAPVKQVPAGIIENVFGDLIHNSMETNAKTACEGIPVYGEALYNAADYQGASAFLDSCRQILPESDYVDRWIALAGIMTRSDSSSYENAIQAAGRIVERGKTPKDEALNFKYYITTKAYIQAY